MKCPETGLDCIMTCAGGCSLEIRRAELQPHDKMMGRHYRPETPEEYQRRRWRENQT